MEGFTLFFSGGDFFIYPIWARLLLPFVDRPLWRSSSAPLSYVVHHCVLRAVPVCLCQSIRLKALTKECAGFCGTVILFQQSIPHHVLYVVLLVIGDVKRSMEKSLSCTYPLHVVRCFSA
uniref:Uncharacterized protein n=1 Tax=Trypanosoma congolense (strain IL3000) TaxID=1068625 RepID=G0USU3_TRYCI|nr:hypothetical protein, unlikely [Trypanosoma congolense IL3000]